MRVKIILRGPERLELAEVEMAVPPRVGEWFSIRPGDAAYVVHSISYMIEDGVVGAEILVR
jgi:hypothetical protein